MKRNGKLLTCRAMYEPINTTLFPAATYARKSVKPLEEISGYDSKGGKMTTLLSWLQRTERSGASSTLKNCKTA